MKKILLTALFTALSSSIALSKPFQQIIGEDAALLFSIRSLSELREQWSEHPMAAIFQDEALLEWFDDSEEEDAEDASQDFFEEMEAVFGLTEDEFFELFSGQVGLALYNLSDQLSQEAEEDGVEFIAMAEFSGNAERLEELMQIQFERNAATQKEANPLIEHAWVEETFMGETLHFDETFDGEKTYVEDGYALVEGIFVLATPESRLRQAVEMIKEGPEASLADLEAYQRSRDHSGRGDIAFYLNLSALVPSFNQALSDMSASSALALFGVTPQSLESALKLEVLQGLFLDFDVIEDGILGYGGILYTEKAGILSLLEYVEGELPEARYVPDDVLNTSITLFDFSAMYNRLEEILGAASPNILSMIDIQLQNVQANTGVDLRTGLLENFGTQIVGFSVLKEGSETENPLEMIQTDQVVVFDLKDAEAFSQALNALIDSAQVIRPMIEESTFEGETIYSIVAPDEATGMETEINYAITRSKFILNVGHISLLHTVLSEMETESDGFWQDPDVLALFERIEQPNPVTRTYYDAEQLIEPLFEMIALWDYSGDPAESSKFEEVPASLQGAYRLISEANEAPDGLFGRTLIVKDEDGE